MKLLAMIIALCLPFMASAESTDYAYRMVKSKGKEWSEEKSWDYVSGLVTKSILKYCQQYESDAFADQAYSWCKKYADNSLYPDGTFINFKKGSLDNIASGKVLLDLYKHEEAKLPGSGQKYKKAADYLYHYLVDEYTRIDLIDGYSCFIHKDRYPYQMWLDGLYMGAAFYAEYQSMFGPDDNDAWEDIAWQFITIHDRTFDTDKRLNYHAWSAKPSDPNSFWANKTEPYKGCSKEFWGRGMGWYFAALVDVLELMPTDNQYYGDLVDILHDVASGLKERQDEASGVWYQLLQYDDTFVSRNGNHNYLEASASCMFTYGYLKGLRLGLLDRDTYLDVAEKAYKGLIDTFIVSNRSGVLTIRYICRSAGLGPASDPSRDGTADYYLDGYDVNIVSNEGKGIGSFIMASLEYELLQDAGINDVLSDKKADCRIFNLKGIELPSAPQGEVYITNGKKFID